MFHSGKYIFLQYRLRIGDHIILSREDAFNMVSLAHLIDPVNVLSPKKWQATVRTDVVPLRTNIYV